MSIPQVGSADGYDDRHRSILSFRGCSLMLGCICGIFVHLSSLAANYFLIYRNNGDEILNHDDKQILITNLLWSLITSSIAFSLLGVLRKVIGQYNEAMLEQLDVFFATGALTGLCCSWIATDISLGLRMRLQTGCFVFVVGLCFLGLLANIRVDWQARILRDRTSAVDKMVEPLSEKDTEELLPTECSSFEDSLRWMGLQSGVLVGVIIQLSSLGANTLLQHDNHNMEDSGRRLMISVAWSFVSSCLGILTLFFIRQLLGLSLPGIALKSLVMVECYFVAGATVGLNSAWAMTDAIIGISPHCLGATVATLVSFAWCTLVVRCCENDRAYNESVFTGSKEQMTNESTHREVVHISIV